MINFKGTVSHQMYSIMKAFRVYLSLFSLRFSQNNTTHFATLRITQQKQWCQLKITPIWCFHWIIDLVIILRTLKNFMLNFMLLNHCLQLTLKKRLMLYTRKWLICGVTLTSTIGFNFKVLTTFMHYWIHPCLPTW